MNELNWKQTKDGKTKAPFNYQHPWYPEYDM